jgi:tetratricopeptide (TPR) repeat protein
MTRLNVTALLLTILLSTSVFSAENENAFDKAQWQYARDYFSKASSEHENSQFNDYPIAKQAMLLGSTLWLSSEGLGDEGKSAEGLNNKDKKQEQKKLAQQLLRFATRQASTLNTFEQGYLYNLLAQSYQRQNNTTQASLFFNKGIAVKYPDACINLGVMWEQQANFKKAEQTYVNCLARSNEFATPLLYLNLGTIYYNGSGQVTKNRKLGTQYWQQSYLALYR